MTSLILSFMLLNAPGTEASKPITEGPCVEVVAGLVPEQSRLYPSDRILLSPFSRRIFGLSKVSRAIARHLKVPKSGSVDDRFLDFSQALREQQPTMTKYIRWLNDVQRLASDRKVFTEVLLGPLADNHFLKNSKIYFEVKFAPWELDETEKMPELVPAEFLKTMGTLRSMTARAKTHFKLALKDTLEGRGKRRLVLQAIEDQRIALRGVFPTAKDASPDMQMLGKLQQFVLMDLDYDFPADFTVGNAGTPETQEKFAIESEIRSRVLSSLRIFTEASSFPESNDYWDELIARVTPPIKNTKP